MPPIWSPSLNESSTAGKHLTHRSSLNHSNAMDGTEDDILWNDETTHQEELETQEDEQYDNDDKLLFNDEDIMSAEQLKQLFMESDEEDVLGFE